MNTASRRRFLVMVFSLLIMVLASIPSFAGYSWCDGDPAFLVDGQYAVNAYVLVPVDKVANVQQAGGATLNVQAAKNTSVVMTDNTAPFPIEVNIRNAGKANHIVMTHFDMYVPNTPGSASFPVALQLTGGLNPTTIYGQSGQWLSYDLVVYIR